MKLLLILVLLAFQSIQHHVIIDDVFDPLKCETCPMNQCDLRLNQCLCPEGRLGPKCEIDTKPLEDEIYQIIDRFSAFFDIYESSTYNINDSAMIQDIEKLYDLLKIKGRFSLKTYESILKVVEKFLDLEHFKKQNAIFYRIIVICRRNIQNLQNQEGIDSAIQIQERLSQIEVERLMEVEREESTQQVFDEWMFTKEIGGLEGLVKLQFTEFSITLDLSELQNNIIQDESEQMKLGFVTVVKANSQYDQYGEVEFITKFYDTLGRELQLKENNDFMIQFDFKQREDVECECFTWDQYKNEDQYQTTKAKCQNQVCQCKLKYFSKNGFRDSSRGDEMEQEPVKKKIKLNDGTQFIVDNEEQKVQKEQTISEEGKQQMQVESSFEYRTDNNNSTTLSEEEKKNQIQQTEKREDQKVDDDDEDFNFKKYKPQQNPPVQTKISKQKPQRTNRQQQTQQRAAPRRKVKPNMLSDEENRRQDEILQLRPPEVISTAPDYFSYYHSEQLIQFLQLVVLLVTAYQNLQQRDSDEKDSLFSRSIQDLFRGGRRDFDDTGSSS